MPALDGLVVVDLSTTVASAFTTLLFADNGAEVVQIERPGGSRLRRMAAWPMWMRGKKSIVLNLRDPAEVAVARSLAAGADVAVESWGPGVAERLGVGCEELRTANPSLVYTSISGFGHSGPFSHLKGYEAVVMAKTGSMYGNIAPDRADEPVMTTPLGATFSGALLAMQGTLIALHEREQSGQGQRVDATLIQGMMAQDPWSYFMKILANRYPNAYTAMGAPGPRNRVPLSWLMFGLLNGYTKDGQWLQFAHATPRMFDAFVDALGLGWTRDDPRWADAANSDDTEVRDGWWTMMLESVRSRTTADWQEIFDRDGNVFAEVYRDGVELFDHPQIVHDGHAVEVQHPELGPVKEMGLLVQMSATPGSALRPVPRLDEDGPALRRQPPAPRPAPAGPPPPPAPPLAGLLVVDLGTFYAGPFASTMLADQGATVVKLEQLEGDPVRFQMPVPEASAVRVTQGKKSIAVNLFTPEGRRIAEQLIRRADIVLHTYRGGVAARMGLDAEAALRINPDVVYHHGVGYGVEGPYARRAAFAPTIAAASGWARRCGGGRGARPRPERPGADGAESGMAAAEDDSGRGAGDGGGSGAGDGGGPLTMEEIKDASVRMGGAQAGHPDGMAALGVAVGMLLGLFARDRGKGGQVTLTSMLSTIGHVLSDVLIDYEGVPQPAVTDPDAYGFGPLYRLYRASDGWIVLCASRESLEAALSFSAFLPPLEEVFTTKTAAEWERQLSAAGIGCAAVEPSHGGLAMGLFEEGGIGDQLGLLTKVHHPIFDEHIRATELVTLSRGTATLGGGCTIGQHTDEILCELLGYSQKEISALRAARVVAG